MGDLDLGCPDLVLIACLPSVGSWPLVPISNLIYIWKNLLSQQMKLSSVSMKWIQNKTASFLQVEAHLCIYEETSDLNKKFKSVNWIENLEFFTTLANIGKFKRSKQYWDPITMLHFKWDWVYIFTHIMSHMGIARNGLRSWFWGCKKKKSAADTKL